LFSVLGCATIDDEFLLLFSCILFFALLRCWRQGWKEKEEKGEV